jgi:hypothetical protein
LRNAAGTEKEAREPRFFSSPDAFERETRGRDGVKAEFQGIAGAVWLVRAHVDLQRNR